MSHTYSMAMQYIYRVDRRPGLTTHARSHLLSTPMLLCLIILSCTLLAVLNKSLIHHAIWCVPDDAMHATCHLGYSVIASPHSTLYIYPSSLYI